MGWAQEGPPPKVGVATVTQKDFHPRLSVLGEIEPSRTGRVSVEMEGLVAEVAVDAGTRVTTETVLLRLDGVLRQLRLEAVQAEAEVARHQLAEYEAGSRVEDISEAEAAVREAQARLDEAKDNLARVEKLAKSDSATREELTRAEAQVRAEEAALDQKQVALERVRSGPRVELIARARATVSLRDAEARHLQAEIQKLEIKAPFAGVVAEKVTERGQYLRVGDVAFVILADDPIRAVINVPERAVDQITRENSIPLTLDALPGRSFDGKFEAVIPNADRRSRTFPVRLRLDNPDGALLPGMFVRANVPLPPIDGALAVPRDALVPTPSGYQIFLVRDGRVVPVAVTRGYEEEDLVEVRAKGVMAGEKVVIRGNDRLREGQPVLITEDSAAAEETEGGRPR